MTDTTGILVFEGFEELDAVGAYEVFGNAAKRGPTAPSNCSRPNPPSG